MGRSNVTPMFQHDLEQLANDPEFYEVKDVCRDTQTTAIRSADAMVKQATPYDLWIQSNFLKPPKTFVLPHSSITPYDSIPSDSRWLGTHPLNRLYYSLLSSLYILYYRYDYVTKASWYRGSMVQWRHGTTAPWLHHGATVPWCDGAMVPW